MDSTTATTTPREWPENALPTPEQAADWLGRCTPEERLRFATVTLRHEQRANDCLVADHEGEIDFLRREVYRLNADLAKVTEASA